MYAVVPSGAVVKAIERLELVYPAAYFAKELKLVGLSPTDKRLSRPVTMVYYRLAEGNGDGWVFERHPDGRVVMDNLSREAMAIHAADARKKTRLVQHSSGASGFSTTISPRGCPTSPLRVSDHISSPLRVADPELTAALLNQATLDELRLRLRSREHLLAMRQGQLEDEYLQLLRESVQGFEETEEQRLDAEREAKLEPDILAVEKLKALVREREEEEGSQ
jgi:hypothetical protein